MPLVYAKGRGLELKVTTIKIKWYYVEFCYDECDIWTNDYTRWEKLTESEKPVHDTDVEFIGAGWYGNQSSADIACEKKCRNLNL